MLSDAVTIFGFSMAIMVFLYEHRKERRDEQEEICQWLSDEYAEFLRLVLKNADVYLLRKQEEDAELTHEQKESKFAIFSILISLFQPALIYGDEMDGQTRRAWQIVGGLHARVVRPSLSCRAQ